MENIPALLIRTCKGPKRAFHSWANLATESNERRSSSITFKNKINKKHKRMQIYERERERERIELSRTSILRGKANPAPERDHWFCQSRINWWAALVFLTAMMTCAPASANCLAVSRPMPLVEPVTMQVRSLSPGGKGIGLCKWLAEILWNSISYIKYIQPLNHSIHPKPSFFFCFRFVAIETRNYNPISLSLSLCRLSWLLRWPFTDNFQFMATILKPHY